MARCRAFTKKRRPCPIEATHTGLCHVHEPSLQCGADKGNGQRCTITTGGGYCQAHAARTKPSVTIPARAATPDPYTLWLAGVLADAGQFS
jgi:hypothetical protein